VPFRCELFYVMFRLIDGIAYYLSDSVLNNTAAKQLLHAWRRCFANLIGRELIDVTRQELGHETALC
jgi:hypothetical protein